MKKLDLDKLKTGIPVISKKIGAFPKAKIVKK